LYIRPGQAVQDKICARKDFFPKPLPQSQIQPD
jgi:hypothetical protein